MTTQSKENLFSQFLFVTARDKGEEYSIWQLIVDTERSYNFEVETNFNYVQLKSIEMRLSEQADMAQMKANNLISEYVNASFMSANERFNSAMVFESQLDETGQREDKKLQRLIGEKNIVEIEEEQEEEGKQEEVQTEMELDNVNQHECMKNIKRCIDRMVELFAKENWDKGKEMPLFMQALNSEIRRADTHINVKIFILKILINK